METSDIVKFVSDGFDKAKGGLAEEVYTSVINLYDHENFPAKSHYPFGWIIYYALHQTPATVIEKRKQMLARYLKLQLERPHKLHSMILTEALRLYKDAADTSSMFKTETPKFHSGAGRFSIMKFSELWGLGNLRPGDWNRKVYNGRRLPSTAERLITCYIDEVSVSRLSPSPEFMKVVDAAMATFADSPNLYAQRARLYELEGNIQAAIELLKKAILLSRSKFYLWSRLAALLTGKDTLRLRISLFHRALTCPGREDVKGKIHLQLAACFAEGGAFPQAKWELIYVKQLYEKKEWRLPRLYNPTLKMLPTGTKASDPASIYQKLAPLADDFIRQS